MSHNILGAADIGIHVWRTKQVRSTNLELFNVLITSRLLHMFTEQPIISTKKVDVSPDLFWEFFYSNTTREMGIGPDL